MKRMSINDPNTKNIQTTSSTSNNNVNFNKNKNNRG